MIAFQRVFDEVTAGKSSPDQATACTDCTNPLAMCINGFSGAQGKFAGAAVVRVIFISTFTLFRAPPVAIVKLVHMLLASARKPVHSALVSCSSATFSDFVFSWHRSERRSRLCVCLPLLTSCIAPHSLMSAMRCWLHQPYGWAITVRSLPW